MLYLNQLEYRHIPYITHTKDDDIIDKVYNVARSGCGLCCLCMMVDQLTTKVLPIEECVKLSETVGANYGAGTDMSMLAPVVAEKFGVEYRPCNDVEEAVRHLQAGGHVIMHVTKQPNGEPGLFTKGGHYISLIASDGEEVCILDPSFTPDKFHTPEREGKVNDKNAPFLYCHKSILPPEAKPDRVQYHLFARKR